MNIFKIIKIIIYSFCILSNAHSYSESTSKTRSRDRNFYWMDEQIYNDFKNVKKFSNKQVEHDFKKIQKKTNILIYLR